MRNYKAKRTKFRVWDRCVKCMHIVGTDHHDYMECHSDDNEVYYCNSQNGDGSITYDEELPEDNSGYILMQYTGRNDASDIEIYEGDIIAFMDGHDGGSFGECSCIGEVIWDEETLSFQVTNRVEAESYDILNEKCKVIGNIYENEELLDA